MGVDSFHVNVAKFLPEHVVYPGRRYSCRPFLPVLQINSFYQYKSDIMTNAASYLVDVTMSRHWSETQEKLQNKYG